MFAPTTEGPQLPTSANEEFRPFIRRLPEFKFWYVNKSHFHLGLEWDPFVSNSLQASYNDWHNNCFCVYVFQVPGRTCVLASAGHVFCDFVHFDYEETNNGKDHDIV